MKIWVMFDGGYNNIVGIFDDFNVAQKTVEETALALGHDINPQWQSYGDAHYHYSEHGAEWSQEVFKLRSYELNTLTHDLIKSIEEYKQEQLLKSESDDD